MYKSGYDPNAFISFFEKVQAEEKKKPGALPNAFSTHPQTPDRIEKSQQEIAQILPARAEYVVTTSEFDVKERLAMLENLHRVVDPEERKKPTLLRRASSGADKSSQDSQTDDVRPTLKRRDDEN